MGIPLLPALSSVLMVSGKEWRASGDSGTLELAALALTCDEYVVPTDCTESWAGGEGRRG